LELQYLTMDSTSDNLGTKAEGRREPHLLLRRIAGSFILSLIISMAVFGTQPETALILSPILFGFFFLSKASGCFLAGSALIFAGLFLIFKFFGVVVENFPLLAVSVSAIALGILVFLGRTTGLAILVSWMTLVFGAVGWGMTARIGQHEIAGVYDFVDKGRAVFFFAEPCFVVDDGYGGVQIVPGGQWGIYPEYPKPEHVGKRIGGNKIIGVVEKGGVVNIYDPDGKNVSVLEFSFVTPNTSEKGGAVVTGLF